MSTSPRLTRPFFGRSARDLAPRLLGQRLVRVLDDGARLSGIIVETEAYLGARDRGAHSFGGRRTQRNEAMYGPAGLLYVYFTYGMHHCCNVVCAREGVAEAVLIRALEPDEGVTAIRNHRMCRPRKTPLRHADLTSGPGRVCEGLAIDRSLNGIDLTTSESVFVERVRSRALPESRIGVGPRIGLGEVGEWKTAPLRWAVLGSQHISKPI